MFGPSVRGCLVRLVLFGMGMLRERHCWLVGSGYIYPKGANLFLSRVPFLISPLSIVSIACRGGQLDRIVCVFLWNGMGEETKFHLVSRNKVCSPISVEMLGFEIWGCLIKLYLESGYEDINWKESRFGRISLIRSMEMLGGVGVLINFRGYMVWIFESSLERVERVLLVMLVMLLVRDL